MFENMDYKKTESFFQYPKIRMILEKRLSYITF